MGVSSGGAMGVSFVLGPWWAAESEEGWGVELTVHGWATELGERVFAWAAWWEMVSLVLGLDVASGILVVLQQVQKLEEELG